MIFVDTGAWIGLLNYFTDCTSFAVCKKLNINSAFSFDKHFTMMGIDLCTK